MSHDSTTKLEPVEIQHVKLRLRPLGYHRDDVDDLLENVTASFEEVWYEREALRDRVQTLLEELERARERDRLIGDVARNAHRAADAIVAEARAAAEDLLTKARRRAQSIVAEARQEPDRLRQEVQGLTDAEQALHERFRTFCSLLHGVLEEGFDEEDTDFNSPDSRRSTPEAGERNRASSSV